MNETILSSFDPLYPLRSNRWISKTIFELFDLQINQFMLKIFGPWQSFQSLQYRLEKLNSFKQLIIPFILYLSIVFINNFNQFIQYIRNELFIFIHSDDQNENGNGNHSDGDNLINDSLD